jgi:hypothetical protein
MNETGHMVVARIAWDTMTPNARKAVAKLVADPNNPSSGKPTSAQDSDRFSAATYMDDIRPTYGHLHFDNQYIDEQNRPMDRPSDSPNSVTFLEDNLKTLADAHASTDQKAEALRYTMHLVGDLHQPLHNVDRITSDTPKGDRGGNLFPIDWHNELRMSNLHAYWDDAAGEFAFIARPLTPDGTRQLDGIAQSIEQAVPESKVADRSHDLNPEHWAAEGLNLATRDCYTGIAPNQHPSEAYRQKTLKDMNEETALAGYRLGHLVNSIFDPGSEPTR